MREGGRSRSTRSAASGIASVNRSVSAIERANLRPVDNEPEMLVATVSRSHIAIVPQVSIMSCHELSSLRIP